MNYDSFLKTTYDYSLFQISNVIGDNKCFYRSVVRSLCCLVDQDSLTETTNITLKKAFRTFNPPETLKNLTSDFEDRAIINLENRIVSWIGNNRDTTNNPVGLPISEIVQMTHEIDIEQYIDRDFDEYPIWAGLPEQIALANIYNIEIYIFRPVRFNKSTGRMMEGIIKGNTPNKDTRFQLSQIIVPSKKTTGNRPIYLLWKRYSSGDDHYMALFPKTADSIQDN